jgi:hypothetical protein
MIGHFTRQGGNGPGPSHESPFDRSGKTDPRRTRGDRNDLAQFVQVIRLALDPRSPESVRMACEKRILQEARQLAHFGFFEFFSVRDAPLRTMFEDEGITHRTWRQESWRQE